MERVTSVEEIVRGLLDGYSAEVTTPDRKALDAAAPMMPPGAPVYIAQLPKDSSTEQLRVAIELRQLGLEPIPHITARSLRNRKELEDKVALLSRQAGVTGALVLAGDRDIPAGQYQSSLELIRSGV